MDTTPLGVWRRTYWRIAEARPATGPGTPGRAVRRAGGGPGHRRGVVDGEADDAAALAAPLLVALLLVPFRGSLASTNMALILEE